MQCKSSAIMLIIIYWISSFDCCSKKYIGQVALFRATGHVLEIESLIMGDCRALFVLRQSERQSERQSVRQLSTAPTTHFVLNRALRGHFW